MFTRVTLNAIALIAVTATIIGCVVTLPPTPPPTPPELQMLEAEVAKWERSKILNLGPVVNSEYRETGLAISGDGQTLFFVSDRPGGLGGRDLWMTTREGDEWTEPVNLGAPVNSPGNDGGSTVSADDKRLFFTSDREEGFGGDDLYMASLVNGRWGEVVNLGDAINSPFNDAMLYITKDDNELYFHSDRPEGFGGTDIYVSRFEDGRWLKAVNLGPEVNSAEFERNPYLSNDGLILFFGIGRSRYEADPSERVRIVTRATVNSKWIEPVTFGPPLNVEDGYQSCTELTNDGKTMFFISNRPGGVGEDDVWMAQSE